MKTCETCGGAGKVCEMPDCGKWCRCPDCYCKECTFAPCQCLPTPQRMLRAKLAHEIAHEEARKQKTFFA